MSEATEQFRRLGIVSITNHAVVRYLQLIEQINVEDDYKPNRHDRLFVEPRIAEKMQRAKILTLQQALVLVKSRTRVSYSAQRAMGSADFQTQGVASFYGNIYDDGEACYVVEDRAVITVMVPDSDQRQAMEDILERASLPPLKLVSSAPEPAPFELCLLEKKLVGDQLTSTHEQIHWWMNRFKRAPATEVRILRSFAYGSDHLRTIDKVLQSLDVRPHVVQNLPSWTPDATPDARKIWRDRLSPVSRSFRHTIVMCATPMELLLSLACLIGERSPLNDEEWELPRGLVYAVDPEILSVRKLSSFWMLK